ncbi:HNH endonuclease [Sunxiuqinia sp. A32]|uniref:HNH endonuclease n=1 Tax=Sunxiuqinia sp. A32 TaxID=3461496 RepID=UPI004045A937
MSELQKYNFDRIYGLIDLIEGNVNAETAFWNFSYDYFIEHSVKFQKETLLHQYIVITALNNYRRDFRKSTDWYEEEGALDFWYEKFQENNISIPKYKFKKGYDAYKWFLRHEKKFEQLYENLANDAFYILFNNRNFLLKFNKIVAESVSDLSSKYPKKDVTQKGTIKRKNIPTWVKNAVFHRDKGRCVFCNTDLTNLVNTLTVKNFDHIVPLDLYGANDPCNIQLSCEKCNKSKSNKEPDTSDKYYTWW